jgi:ubiquinone/menaquinone biosynthesis C-methylase UbiE
VEEGSQDMAFMCYVIRHFDDQKKLQILENIYKILKEDGALYDVGHIKHANVRKEL